MNINKELTMNSEIVIWILLVCISADNFTLCTINILIAKTY